MEDKDMDNTLDGEWVADVRTMSCRNDPLGVTFFFRRREKAQGGKSFEMIGMKLLCISNKDKIPEKVFIEAEKVFLNAYNENSKKKNDDELI
jgi:hypothetical protein